MYQRPNPLASPAPLKERNRITPSMFALIRHAGYQLGSGSLTPEGNLCTQLLAQKLLQANTPWESIRTSPSTRTKETSSIIAEILNTPVEIDKRVEIGGNFVDLLPPHKPKNIIFVSHLPVLTQILRIWSRSFGQKDEPPLTEVSCGYLIDPAAKTIVLICQ